MDDPIYPFSNRPLITWDIEYALLALFESPVEQLRARLPGVLRPLEVRPGIGLFSISLVQYYPWQQARYPELHETVFNIHVHPDLKWGVPTVALFVASFGSNDASFLEEEAAHNLFPVYEKPLSFRIDPENHVAACWDEEGPLYRLTNPSTREPAFTRQHTYAQVYVEHEGRVYRSHNTYRGAAFQHQDSGETGVIHDHPFFRGAGVAAVNPSCYMMTLTPPQADLRQVHYWRPEQIDREDGYAPPVDVKQLTPEQRELLRLITYADNIPRPFRVPVPA